MAKRKPQEILDYVWASLRISLGAIFLWAFIDKFWGMGFATCRNDETGLVTQGCASAVVEGGSATTGFLKFGTQGPFADQFANLAGNDFVDLLFMAGLLGIGLALILGIGVRVAVISGIALMGLMYFATLWPENNPVFDDHVIYSIVLIGIWFANEKQKWGLRDWWVKQPIVKHFPFLE